MARRQDSESGTLDVFALVDLLALGVPQLFRWFRGVLAVSVFRMCAYVLVLCVVCATSTAVVAAEASMPSTAVQAAPSTAAEAVLGGGRLSPSDAAAFLRATPTAFVLDVRLPEELVSGVLSSSVNVPLRQLEAYMGKLSADRPIVIYCAVGRRAKRAYDKITQMRTDILNVYYIDGKPLFDN